MEPATDLDYLDTEYDPITNEYRVIGETRTALVFPRKNIYLKENLLYAREYEFSTGQAVQKGCLADFLS